MNARRTREAIRDAARTLRDRSPEVVYLGWVGRGNLGDEAIYDAHRRSLQPLRTAALSMTGYSEVLAELVRDQHVGRRPLLLGGGTVVGRSDWRLRLEEAEMSLRPSGLFMLGAGVEDPAFVGRRSYSSIQELRRWKPVLARFDRVTVRGPRSQALLADVGVEARVSGDPALLWADEVPFARVQPDLVALNVAIPEDLWGGDWKAVVKQVAQAVRLLLRSGLRIKLLPLHPADKTASKALLRLLPRRAPIEVVNARDTTEVLDALRPCAALIGQRLHAVVLGAAVHVPGIALDYRPKCADFQASIGRSEWLVPTRDLPPQQLAEMALELVHQHARHRERLSSGVLPLLTLLRHESQHLRERLNQEAARRRAIQML